MSKCIGVGHLYPIDMNFQEFNEIKDLLGDEFCLNLRVVGGRAIIDVGYKGYARYKGTYRFKLDHGLVHIANGEIRYLETAKEFKNRITRGKKYFVRPW